MVKKFGGLCKGTHATGVGVGVRVLGVTCMFLFITYPVAWPLRSVCVPLRPHVPCVSMPCLAPALALCVLRGLEWI